MSAIFCDVIVTSAHARELEAIFLNRFQSDIEAGTGMRSCMSLFVLNFILVCLSGLSLPLEKKKLQRFIQK